MKKKAVSLLVVLAAMGGLTGCGGTASVESVISSTAASSVESSVVSSSYTGEKTEINIWTTIGQNNRSTFEAAITDFETAYPQYDVVPTYQSGNYNQLKDAVVKGFSADNYPDLVQCYPDHVAEYLNYGKAVNLDTYINDATYGLTTADKADYVKAFWDEGTQYSVSGTFSVPFCKSTELMFYNEDVLVGLNLSAQDATINGGNVLTADYLNNLTWEELFNHLCPAIVAYNATLADNAKILKTDQAYHSVFAYDSDDNLFITLAQQYGNGYTSVNTTTGKGSADFVNDGNKNLMKTFHTAAGNGYIISKGSAGNNYTNTYFTAQNTLFSVGSTGGVKYQFSDSNPMNVGVARIPHAKDKDAKVISQGPSLVVLNHNDDKRKLGSWLFYKYLTNAKNSLAWALNTGYMPVRSSCYTTDAYKETYDVDSKADKTLDKLMARSGAYVQNIINETYTSPAFLGSSACRTAVSGIMTKALTATNDIANLDTWFQDAYAAAVAEIK